MRYLKRAKGWRNITVEEQQFRWRFNTSGRKGNTLRLQGASSVGQQVIVTLHGWYDVWEFIGHFDKLPNNPHVFTGKFVAQAIQFALANGWVAEQAGPPIALNYDNGSCALSQQIGGAKREILIDTTSDMEKKFPTFVECLDLKEPGI